MKSEQVKDSTPWSDMDLFYLRAALEDGTSVEETAMHLGRSGSVEGVRDKAAELGLIRFH